MRVAYKVLLVVVLPMLILAGYQFITVHQTFNLIEDVRSNLFLDSAREVKYAGDVLFMTGVINSILFEIHTAAEIEDANAISQGIRRYREVQLQRYYSLQKLKEVVGGSSDSQFDFIRILDDGRENQTAHLEKEISEIDALNEEIISGAMITDANDSVFAALYEKIRQSNEKTRILAEDLAVFTNDRYIKIEGTSKLVGETEARAENTLNMILLLGYFLAGIMVLFIYSLIIRPLERFARAIELKTMDTTDWRAFEPVRKDEIGVLYHALHEWLHVPVQKQTKTPTVARAKKKKGKGSPSKK